MTWRDKFKLFFIEKVFFRIQKDEKKREATMAKFNVGLTLNEDPISAMAEIYKNAEDKWLKSSMNNEQEKNYRLNFMRTHQNELKKLNDAIGKVAPANRKAVREKLEDAGIAELLKDYNAVFNRDSRGFIMQDSQYLMEDQNSFADNFRKEMKDIADKRGYSAKPMDDEISKFQKFLYSKIDYKKDGTARLFTEDFMSMPDDIKLKVLYSIENNITDTPVTDEMISDYHPDCSKLIFESTKSVFNFRRKSGSADLNYEKIKKCIDKENIASKKTKQQIAAEQQAKAEQQAEAEQNEPEQGNTQPELKRTNRHRNNIASNVMLYGSLAGSALTSKSAALKPVSDLLGVAMSAVDVGKSITELCIAGKNRSDMTKAAEKIQNLKKNEKLKKGQKNALEKLEKNVKTVHTLNRAKTKTQVVNTISGAINLTASIAAPKASLVVFGITTIIAEPIKGVIKSNVLTEIVDERLFKSKEDFEQKKANALIQTRTRLLRMPRKMQDKYKKSVESFIKDDKAIRASLRDEGIRQAGEVDQEGMKNKIVYDIGDVSYMLLREQAQKKSQNSQDQVDVAIEEIAKSVVKAAGGKEIDFSKMTNLGEEAKPEERETIAKDISKRAIDMSRS